MGLRFKMTMLAIAVPVIFALPLMARAEDQSTSSVAVQLAPATRGSAPVLVTAYGVVTPGPDAQITLSLPVTVEVRPQVSVGQAVHQGDALLSVTLTPEAVSARIQAEAAVKLAQAQLAHVRSLFTAQLATRDQVAQAENAQTNARAAAAALATAGSELRAPFDGTVTALPVGNGERAAAGTALVSLTRAAGLVAELGVEPADRAKLAPGDQAQLVRLAASGAAGAAVQQVGAIVDAKTGLVAVRLAAPPGWLAGEAVRADITVGSVAGWIMPRDAVLDDSDGSYLFQAVGGKAHRVAATRLGFAGDQVVVAAKLDPGASVVILGNYQLDDGDALRAATP